MSGGEEQNKGLGEWLGEALPGGIPQFIAGPAGAAISRLIGGVADIPAAWLEQKAQAIRDETSARSAVLKTLSEKSAELGLKDEALLSRGLDNLLGRAYREQRNREGVAREAVEQLRIDPPPLESTAPTDDWMNIFEGHAAKASSETMRTLFASVLAGELRKPGSFSLATMHMLSVLDQQTALLINRIAPYVVGGVIIFRSAVDGHLSVAELVELENAGVLTGSGGTLSSTPTCDANGYCLVPAGTQKLRAKFAPNQKLSISAYMLTRAGKELLGTIPVGTDIEASAQAFWEAGASEVQRLVFDHLGNPVTWMDLQKPK